MKNNKFNNINKIIIFFSIFLLLGMIGVSATDTLQNGLLVYYNPEQINNWNDLSGNGNNAISHNQASNKTFFDGLNNYVSINRYLSSSNSYTFLYKIKTTQNAQYKYLFDTSDSVSDGLNNRIIIGSQWGDDSNNFCLVLRVSGNDEYICSNTNIDDGQEHTIILTRDYNSKSVKIYIDNSLDTSGSFYNSITLDRFVKNIGSAYSAQGSFFNGNIYKTVIYDRALTESEVAELYEKGGNPLTSKSKQEQTYNQNQLSNININDTNWHTITSGNFNLTEDNITNYGEAIVYAFSQTNNMVISCRTNLDGINGTVGTKLIINNGEIKTNILLRNNISLNTGIHNVSLQCKNEIIGDTVIGASVGIGHIMKTSENDSINYKNYQFNKTIDSGVSFSEIGTTNFTTNESTSDFKYILVDWSVKINNTLGQDQTFSVYPKIENILTNKQCEIHKQFIKAGEYKTIGGLCQFEANELTKNTISLYGTGLNAVYTGNMNIKEFDYITTEEIKTNILTGININSTTYTEKASTTFNTELGNSEIIVKGSLSATSNTNNILFGKIEILDDIGVAYTTKEIAMTTNSNSEDITFQAIIPIKSNVENTIKLYMRGQNSNIITISGGGINGYITEKLDIVDNAFNITAYHFWNQTQLNNFSAIIGGATFSTIGNTISVIGDNPYEDILVSKDNFINRLYPQHDTTINLNSSIGENQANLKIYEKYTNETIQNFTLHTSIGNFTTDIGILTIFPNVGIYNWNITSNTYHPKNDIEYQISSGINDYNKYNFIDTIINFVNVGAQTIIPKCQWLNNELIGNYNISAQNRKTSNLTCILEGYIPFIGSFETNFPQNLEITMLESKITVNLYDRVTGNLLNQLANINIGELTSGVTSNGTIIFRNTSFLPNQYTVTASSNDYFTDQKEFNYNAQEEVEVSLYLLRTDNNKSSSLYVTAVDSFTQFLPDVNMILEEFDNNKQEWKAVGQCTTNSNGECQFLIEIGEKRYRVHGTKEINQVLQESYTIENGEIFQPEFSNGQVIYGTQIVRTLTLISTPKLTKPIFEFLLMDYPKKMNETIIFQNDSNYIANIPVSYSSTNNLDYEICLEWYKIKMGQEEFQSKECSKSNSGTITGVNYLLSRDSHNLARITAKQGKSYKTVYEYNYISNNSLYHSLNKINLVPSSILLLWIALLTLSIYLSNISIFSFGAYFLAILQLSVFPSFINIASTILIILIATGLLSIGRKKEDSL